jgi:CAAX prenyl protease-like protein
MQTAQLEATASGHASPAWRYVLPFAVFMLFLQLSGHLGVPQSVELPVRFVLIGTICVFCWPREISFRIRSTALTLLAGAGVLVIWIAPEVLYHGYRNLWPFSNAVIGHVHSSLPPAALRSPWVLFWRTARAVLVVPIAEELFWRGWLMRWLIVRDFWKVPIGTYALGAFWISAALFASEHGPYWDVGLLAGIAYNALCIRTCSLFDCMLAHSITNGLLSWYVIAYAQWQYWQ